MKKIVLLLTIITIICTLFQATVPDSAIAEEKTLHVVTSSDTPTTLDRLLYHMYQRIGYNIYIESCTMKSACEMTDDGSADALSNGSKSFLSSYPQIMMIPEKLADTDFVAYTREGSDIAAKDWSDLSGLRVGMQYQKVYIQEHVPNDAKEVQQYTSVQELNQALLDDEVDVIIITRGKKQIVKQIDGVELSGIVDSIPSYTMVNSSHADLIPKLTKALKDMKADGTYNAIVNGTYPKADTKKVLHISSYTPDDAWDTELQSAMQSVFTPDSDVTYCNVPLNSTRYHSNEDMIEGAYSTIRNLTMDRLPDLVIASDNTALDFVLEHGLNLFGKTPTIYCGITASDEYFQKLPEDYYGLAEWVSALDNVKMIESLCPKAEEVFIINDSNKTGRAVQQVMADDLKSYDGKLKISYNKSYDFADVKEEIADLPPDTAILLGTFSSNQQGNTRNRQNINNAISKMAPGPMFSLSTMGNGETGGIRSSAELQGKEISKIALKILNGADPESISYPPPSELIVAEFDWDMMEKYGLDSDNLPEDAVIINKPLNFWESNPAAFALMMLFMVLLICFAVIQAVQVSRTKSKNKALLEAQESLVSMSELQKANEERLETAERLTFALNAANAFILEIDVKEKYVYFDDNLKSILEFDHDSPAPLDTFSKYISSIMIDDSNMDYGDLQRIISTNNHSSIKLELLLPSGKTLYLSVNVRSYSDENENKLKYFSLMVDITKQEEAISSAQEISTRILNGINEMIYVSDIETDELLFVNNAMLNAFGITEYKGKKCWDIFATYGERCSFCPKNILDKNPGDTYIWEKYHPTLKLYARHVDKYIRWVDGQMVLLHVQFDISDKRSAEEAMKRQLEQQQLMADVSASLIQLGEIDELVSRTLEKVGGFFGCARVLLALPSGDGSRLIPTYEWINPYAGNQRKRTLGTVIDQDFHMPQNNGNDEDPVKIFGSEYSEITGSEDINAKSTISILLMVKGTFAGVFEVSFEEPHEWSNNEKEMVRMLGNTFAMLINRHSISVSLVEAKEEAEQANLAKSQFLSTMSHEIRTPLNAIIGLVQILLHKDMSPDFRNHLSEIEGSSQHLLSIINDILDMSKIEAGKVVLANESFSLYDAMEEVKIIFLQRMQEAEIDFKYEFEGLDKINVQGDKLVLKQVLINLLSNAVKFTDRGGRVTFHVEANTLPAGDIHVNFEVKDNGIGMSQDQVEKLFQPFEQTDRNISARYGGTGLGLAISAKLVKLMGGNINVESNTGSGSEFGFDIIFKAGEGQINTSHKDNELTSDFTGKNIMVAEDIPINRQIVVELLKDTGATLDEVENGQEALMKYKADPDLYDLILMDVLMPVVDGLEATKEIHKLDHLRSRDPVPIIALTANAFQEDVNTCLDAGMVGHVSKPVNYQELVETISKFL